MKSKKLIIYEDRNTGSLFIRSTNAEFKLKNHSLGKALGRNVTDAELGKTMRAILQNCD
jgi:hypothetical protein